MASITTLAILRSGERPYPKRHAASGVSRRWSEGSDMSQIQPPCDHSCWRSKSSYTGPYEVPNVAARPPEGERTCPACAYERGDADGYERGFKDGDGVEQERTERFAMEKR